MNVSIDEWHKVLNRSTENRVPKSRTLIYPGLGTWFSVLLSSSLGKSASPFSTRTPGFIKDLMYSLSVFIKNSVGSLSRPNIFLRCRVKRLKVKRPDALNTLKVHKEHWPIPISSAGLWPVSRVFSLPQTDSHVLRHSR